MKLRFIAINLFALCLLALPFYISAQGGGAEGEPGSGGGGGIQGEPTSGSPIRITIDNPP